MKEILSNEALNNQFISSKTEHFDEFTQALSEVSWERIVQDSGIERQDDTRPSLKCVHNRAPQLRAGQWV